VLFIQLLIIGGWELSRSQKWFAIGTSIHLFVANVRTGAMTNNQVGLTTKKMEVDLPAEWHVDERISVWRLVAVELARQTV
jgi:hypothetical protein